MDDDIRPVDIRDAAATDDRLHPSFIDAEKADRNMLMSRVVNEKKRKKKQRHTL
jgi:hypothetical protein